LNAVSSDPRPYASTLDIATHDVDVGSTAAAVDYNITRGNLCLHVTSLNTWEEHMSKSVRASIMKRSAAVEVCTMVGSSIRHNAVEGEVDAAIAVGVTYANTQR
jgi:hypothetical protein